MNRSTRNLLLTLFTTIFMASGLFASDMTLRIDALLDTDHSSSTGCTVAVGTSSFAGVDEIFSTNVAIVNNVATVTGTTSSICSGGHFSSPTVVDSTGWPVGIDTMSGNLLVESRLPRSTFGNGGDSMRVGFVLTEGSNSSSLLSHGRDPILFPGNGRFHAIELGDNDRTFVLDGLGGDWDGLEPLVSASGMDMTSGQLIDVFMYRAVHAFYFRFDATIHPGTPIANDDSFSVIQGHSLIVSAPGVLQNDLGPADESLSAILTAMATNGTVELHPDGSFLYSNSGGTEPTDTFFYRAQAGTLTSNQAKVTISVFPDQPPVARGDHYSVAHGGTLVVNPPGVLSNDSDADGDALSASLVAHPTNGTVVLHANGGFTYTHNGSNTLSDAFTYLASDGILTSAATTVHITIAPDQAPVAVNDAYAVVEGGTLVVPAPGVLGNDLDSDTPPAGLTTSVVTGPVHGSLTLNANGSFTYVNDNLSISPDSFTYQVSDGILTSNVATVSIAVSCHTITVTAPSSTSEPAGMPFSIAFTQTGITGTANFALASGTLPSGVTLAADGTLSGTPTQNGSFPITVSATDTSSCSGVSATYTLVITCQSIDVTNPATSTAVAAAAFSQSFTQSGAIGGATFTLGSGTLPAGLTLATDGTLSGTPTQTGSFPITVEVTDGDGCTGVGATYTLVITCQTIFVTDPATSAGTVDAAFSQNFTQSGSIGTATFSTMSTLPPGLSLSTAGILSGIPAVPGTYPIVVKVTDSNGCTGSSATYTLVINCQPISVTSPATTTGTVSAPFSQTFTQSGAHISATFSTSSALPAGITLSTAGVLSGTPTVPGSFPIVVTATDVNGCTGVSATYTLVISCQTIVVTNPANTNGTVSTPFSEQFTQTAAVGGATFTLASGTLPGGLTLSASGLLSGTPIQTGSFPITVTVTDGNGCTGTSSSYTLVIACQIINVTSPATTTGIAGTPFSQTFTQTGGLGTVVFTTSSPLPAGLSLASNGVLSGTPTATGSFPITVTATDVNGCTGVSSTYTLVIACQTINVTNPVTATGVAAAPFSQTFTQSGAIGGATFTTVSTLPAGLSLSTAGVLSGTPTQTGSFPIVVTVTDGNGCTGTSVTYNLTITCQTITVTAPGTTTGTANAPFSQNFTQTGAIGVATFTLASGTLPGGVTLATNGTLSGIPLQTGSFPITVRVTDGNGCTGTSATYTLTISCQTILVSNPGTTTGTASTPFSQTFTATNAIGTQTFTTTSTLPAGLTLSTAGVLSGTPTQTGSFPIVVMVTDVNGCTGTGATYTLVIACQVISVTNPSTTTGSVSSPFSAQFTQSGALGTATFTTASTLPAGVTLSTSGLLSGTPLVSGTFPITVTVTDGNGCTGTSAIYTLAINCQPINVTNPATTTDPAGTPFSVTFTQSGGIGTTTFSTSSTLPTGLTFHAATGVLDGTPLQGGTFPIVVVATDSNGCTGIGATYNLVITCPVITVTDPGVSSGTAGTAFSQTFTQSGGIGTITWSETGTLPAGITLNPATGVLSGTTSQIGSFPITVTATDQNGCTGAGVSYNLTFGCQTVTVTNPGVNTGTVDASFNQTFTAATILGTVTWTETGALPSGVTLNSSTGVLSGTPAVPGTFPITVKATDTNGCFGTSSYTLTVSCQTITVTKPLTATGTVDAPFSQTFTQSGAHGTATFTTGSTLPAGLSLSPAGLLSGVPTVKGSFPIVVTVIDSNLCTGISSTYTLVINCQPIFVTNPATTSGTVSAAFSQTFSQAGAHGSATFTTASTLPAGLTLSAAGILSGTPTQSGTFPIVVTVTDSNGCSGLGATYTLVIGCQTITVTNPLVTSGTVATAFSATFSQSGGIGTISFTTASTLPAGLTLHAATGVLDGTPIQSGSFPIIVTATDSNGCTGVSATYTLVIACNVISVTSPGVTTGTAGTAFSQTFTQSGGNGTITWSKTGTLPTGITLNSSTGVLSGTTTQTGSFPITVTATDTNGCTGTSATYTLVIGCQTITVTDPATAIGTAGVAFSQTFTKTGILGTVTWSESGALPTGITFNSSTGVLSGTTTQIGSFPITVTATDTNGCSGVGAPYNLTFVCPTITVTNPITTAATFNTVFSQTFTQSGALGTPTFSLVSGTLPTGITLSGAGVLSGTPTQTGTFPITVKVTDSNTCSGTGATYTLSVAPVATADSYGSPTATAGLVDNTQAVITGGGTTSPTTPFVSLTGAIISNDFPAGGVAANAGTFATAAGGSVTIASDGTFIYTPKANPGAAAITTDSFTYTVSSNTGGIAPVTSAPATVTLSLANRVWYVKNNAAGGGNGQSQAPFNTLAAASSAATAGDIIFVYNGDGTNAGQSAGITLLDGQKLWGEGIGLTVNTHPLVAAGTQPRIKNTATAVVTVDTSTSPAGNRQNVEIRGVDLENTGGTGVTVTSNLANLVGVTISNDNFRGATLQGVKLTQGSTGAFGATVSANTMTAAGNGIQASTSTAGTMTVTTAANTITVTGAGANGLDLRTAAGAGSLNLALDTENVTASGNGIVVDGSAAGTTTISSLQNNSINGNTVGSGILVTNATFDAAGTAGFQTVPGGTTSIGVSGNGVGGSGMLLNNVKGDLSFTDLDIFNDGGTGLLASSGAAFNGPAATGFQIAVTSGVGTVTSVGGPAVALTLVKANLPFTTISDSNSSADGVLLNTVTGTFSAGSGSTISNATGTDFEVLAGTATITYGGTISDATGRLVTVAGATGGTDTFSGTISDGGGGTGSGIFLNGNTGTTINFTAKLTLTTGANDAFTATGGGTVSSSDTTSTVTTTTGTAINVQDTTIGAAGLKFATVSAGTAASGPANGIVLNSTGPSGSLSVSGGTIQKTTSDGVVLINTLSPSFSNVTIKNAGGSGIKGTGVTNFSFVNGTIDTTGTGTDESNIAFNTAVAGTENNVSGTLTITGNTLSNSAWHGIDVQNFSGTLTTVAISGNTITSPTAAASSSGSGIRLQALGSATTAAGVTNATITSNTIRNFPSGAGILAQGGNASASGPVGTFGTAGNAGSIISITGNQIAGQSAANEMGTSAIIASVEGKGQANFDLSNNGTIATPLQNMAGTAILCGGNGDTTSTFNVAGNVIVANNTVASNGIGGGTGVTFGTSDTPNMTWTITSNNISKTDGNGILTVARGATGFLKVKIQNNTVAAPLSGVREGIRVDAGNASSVDDGVCLNISGNTSAGSGGVMGIGLRKQGTVPTTNDFGINGMAATSTPGVETFVNGLNPAGGGTLLISATSGFSNCSNP